MTHPGSIDELLDLLAAGGAGADSPSVILELSSGASIRGAVVAHVGGADGSVLLESEGAIRAITIVDRASITAATIELDDDLEALFDGPPRGSAV